MQVHKLSDLEMEAVPAGESRYCPVLQITACRSADPKAGGTLFFAKWGRSKEEEIYAFSV
jgi:hypothetical protein